MTTRLQKNMSNVVITVSTVVLNCYKGDKPLSQRETPIFGPP